MSNFLVTLFGVILADRGIALVVWAIGRVRFQTGLAEFFRIYGLFAFPRTLMGALVCIPDLMGIFIPVPDAIRALSFLILYSAFVAVAGYNAMKANRSGTGLRILG
jgi:hypothetical protein